MWSVPTSLRPMAMSLMTISIHLLGDVPSPPLLGWLQARRVVHTLCWRMLVFIHARTVLALSATSPVTLACTS